MHATRRGLGDWAEVLREASKRSAEIESARRLPADLAAALADSGIFSLWIAEACGGPEVDVQAGLDAIENAAYHDGSTGWCVMIANTTALMSGKLPPAHAKDLFGGPRSVAGGFAVPMGNAVQLSDGALRVSGEWGWGSGSSHCTSFGGGVRILDHNGAPSALSDGSTTVFAFFDLDDVEFRDTWHASGLKGTASTDYRVSEALVPAGRWVPLDRRAVVVDTPLFNFPTMGALALGVSMVAAGLARRAVDELVQLGARVPQGSSRSLAQRSGSQARLAEAEASVLAGRALVTQVVGETWETVGRGEPAGDEHKRLLRLAAAHATRAAAHAVDLCYHAAGGASVYDHSPLQRVFRDVHVATQHAMVADRILEPIGRMRFGLDTDTRML